MKIRCLIIEDEPIAQEILKSYADRVDNLEVVAQFRNALDAFTFLQHTPVHLLFLDIKMPRMTGLELLKALPAKPKAIIVSAYRDYALDAFDLEVVDYLLKPVSFERFQKGVARVAGTTAGSEMPLVAPKIDQEKPHLFVKGNKQLQKVYIDQILFLESQRDYVRIKLVNQPDIVTRQTITYFEEFLPVQLFLRVHRSFIVAISKISSLEANRLFLGEMPLPVGRNYKQAVQEHFRNLATGGSQR